MYRAVLSREEGGGGGEGVLCVGWGRGGGREGRLDGRARDVVDLDRSSLVRDTACKFQ
jgi:hypothetical protein